MAGMQALPAPSAHHLGSLGVLAQFLGALVHSLAQGFARLEVGHALARDRHTLAAARVAAHAGRGWLIEKLPKPRISIRWPRTSASPKASRMVLTACSASRCVNWLNRLASSSTRSDRVMGSV